MNRPPAIFASHVAVPSLYLHDALAERLIARINTDRSSMRGVSTASLTEQALAARWLIECLYQGFCCVPSVGVALPRSTAASSKSRSGGLPFGYKLVTRAVDAAKKLGWLRVQAGTAAGEGQLTRLWPDGLLLAEFDALGRQWQAIEPLPRNRLLVVKAEKPPPPLKPLPYPSLDIHAATERLLRINEHLAQQCIYLDCPDEVLLAIGQCLDPDKANGRAQPLLNFSHVQLRRIFSRGRYDMGGRFYGGWWQWVPSQYRRSVVINDWPTVECDFSGMALRCLYALENIDLGDSDPYDIGIPYDSPNDPRRGLVKKYVNAILNDETGWFGLKKAELALLGLNRAELRQRVYRRHSKISRHFCTGIGLQLQFVDSEIAERVMLRFIEQGETCLTIHDSFIVRAGLQDALVDAMSEAFLDVTGRSSRITLETELPGEHVWRPSADLKPKISHSVVDQAVDVLRQHVARFSISGQYFASYQEAVRSDPRCDQAVVWHEQADWSDHMERGLSAHFRQPVSAATSGARN